MHQIGTSFRFHQKTGNSEFLDRYGSTRLARRRGKRFSKSESLKNVFKHVWWVAWLFGSQRDKQTTIMKWNCLGRCRGWCPLVVDVRKGQRSQPHSPNKLPKHFLSPFDSQKTFPSVRVSCVRAAMVKKQWLSSFLVKFEWTCDLVHGLYKII